MNNMMKRIALTMLLLVASTAMAYARKVDYQALKKNKGVEITEISGAIARTSVPNGDALKEVDHMYVCNAETPEGIKALRKAFKHILSGKDKRVHVLVDAPAEQERTRIFGELKPGSQDEYTTMYIVCEEKDEIDVIVFEGNFTKDILNQMQNVMND